MQKIFVLSQNELPTRWYNVLADLDRPLDPLLDPATREPLPPEALKGLFSKTCVEQEASTDRFVDIPAEVQEIYRLWRPTPLHRALSLERELDTPAHIYYKYEGASPTGSHKTNTAVAQAYYNKIEGTKRLTTETGAGQWGSALSFACQALGMDVTVFMVKVSYDHKPYRKAMIELYGGEIIPSPSYRTKSGQAVLERDPDSPGSLGIAISEAVEEAVTTGAKYSLGSVLNHVLLHQTVIGQEALSQMELAGEYPDAVVGCVGGGSNYAGLMLPILSDAKSRGRTVEFVAAEPTACPTMTNGEVRYDFGDEAEMTPLLWMHTLGHKFVPPPIHAGGLRYHGMAPIITRLVEDEVVKPVAFDQVDVFGSATLFARTEGIIPAPETAHAVHAAIELARQSAKRDEKRVILIGFSGHGYFDMSAYTAYLAGQLVRTS